MGKTVHILDNEDNLIAELGQKIENSANNAISACNIFTVGLSGGSMINLLAKTLSKISTDLSKWKFFFCDERIVPFADVDSTFGAYRKAFRNVVNVTDDQFVTINPDLNAKDAAVDYIKKMSAFFPADNIPKFDLLLLGIGPDGHTCSLFPNHPLLDETSSWVAAITDSPKPPPSRITLTFPVINNAQLVIFVVQGENKASVIKEILEDNNPLPAQRVQPTKGDLVWLLDQGAASKLKG